MPKLEESKYLTQNLNESQIQIKRIGMKYNCSLFLSLIFIYSFGFVSGYIYHGYTSSDGSSF